MHHCKGSGIRKSALLEKLHNGHFQMQKKVRTVFENAEQGWVCHQWLLWRTFCIEGSRAETHHHCSCISRDASAFRGEGSPQTLQTRTRHVTLSAVGLPALRPRRLAGRWHRLIASSPPHSEWGGGMGLKEITFESH